MAETRDVPNFSRPASETWLRRVLARPRLPALVCIAVLAGLAWIAILLTAGAAAGEGDTLGGALAAALCRPSLGTAATASASGAGSDRVLVALMWAAMTFAMMLPTAAPMVSTYADIAETASARRERVVPPLVLVAGYIIVWLGFALAATALQEALLRLALLDPALAAVSTLFSGAIFLGAGAYQFSPLKHACLTLCGRPFPYLLANWRSEAKGVFRLGLAQGLYCLGCCWAIMLVMFAVGVMNVAWMAVLGVVMGMEKLFAAPRLARAIGVVLMGIGALFVASSVVEHWPARAG